MRFCVCYWQSGIWIDVTDTSTRIVACAPGYAIWGIFCQAVDLWYSKNIWKVDVWYQVIVLGHCIAAATDPARDYWCANRSIETQAA